MPVPLPFGRGVMVCGPRSSGARIATTGKRRDSRRSRTALNQAAARADAAVPAHDRRRLLAPAGPSPPRCWRRRFASTCGGASASGREIAARLPERRGIDPTPRPAGPLLWLHAASVGETMSILPVLQALRHRTKVLADHRHRDVPGAAGSAHSRNSGCPGMCCTASRRWTCRPGSIGFCRTGSPMPPASSKANCGPTNSPPATRGASS